MAYAVDLVVFGILGSGSQVLVECCFGGLMELTWERAKRSVDGDWCGLWSCNEVETLMEFRVWHGSEVGALRNWSGV